MFTSVLIANRGEIAVRITKTLRRMGIRSVVVASIPDRRSLAVRSADAWVLLEGYSAAESYLDVDAVIAAAKAEGCEAIHPGYGFLSERADFAERCAAEGITFIGPPPAVLRGMGDKAAARQLAVSNGVPVVPGWDDADDPETLVREAASIGYPVMLKARGGGGGRGMREVFAAEELPDAIESARREALAAFGDGGLLLEKLVTNAHHVEVQVLADTHGKVIHLGERDCSVQRRHQKLIEETPSPVVDDELRERLTGYALKLARAINYVNAGTFEFLVEVSPSPVSEASRERGSGGEGRSPSAANVYFLEVNPRLQVEHPVTEMVTGLDLVELQLRVAAGEELPMRQEDVVFSGHAIEFRINAEDPWDGFKPSSGRIAEESFTFLSYKCHSGYEAGDVVPAQYDSLLAKYIASGSDRSEALVDARDLLGAATVFGVGSNLLLQRSILTSKEFESGDASISWLENNLDEVLARGKTSHELWAMAAASLMAWRDPGEPQQPLTSPCNIEIWLSDGSSSQRVNRHSDRSAPWEVNDVGVELSLVRWHPNHFRANWNGIELNTLVQGPMQVSCWRGEEQTDYWAFQIVPPPPLPRRAAAVAAGATAVVAPLSGTVVGVRVAEGEVVETGQVLLLLEAMKMEHRIVAPGAGMVKAVLVKERDVVREGDVLVELGAG